VCPIWPGHPITAHWGIPDPAAVEGTSAEQWAAFRAALTALETRIQRFLSLPVGSLDRTQLQASLRDIGQTA
jgi:arsenate reductase (thioredoxin)